MPEPTVKVRTEEGGMETLRYIKYRNAANSVCGDFSSLLHLFHGEVLS